jgi:hypothetical protein
MRCFDKSRSSHAQFSGISKVCLFVWIVLSVSLLFCFTVSAEIYGQFVGWNACAGCHRELCEGWQKTAHSTAFDSLEESKQQDLPDCVQCHVVGYDQSGGFLDQELTAELAGVQCECCHGPGKRHVEKPRDPGRIIRSPSENVCRKCHTPGQALNFDYKQKIKSVHGK